MFSSSPIWLAYSNQAWLRPWSDCGEPQTGVRNSVRPTISSTTAGTWCCQQPAPRKFRVVSQVSLRDRSSTRWRLSSASDLSCRGSLSGAFSRCDAGICSKSSSTLAAPISLSIACLMSSSELAIQGWAEVRLGIASLAPPCSLYAPCILASVVARFQSCGQWRGPLSPALDADDAERDG